MRAALGEKHGIVFAKVRSAARTVRYSRTAPTSCPKPVPGAGNADGESWVEVTVVPSITMMRRKLPHLNVFDRAVLVRLGEKDCPGGQVAGFYTRNVREFRERLVSGVRARPSPARRPEVAGLLSAGNQAVARLLAAGPRTLRRGSRGDDVAGVQDRLNAHGAAPPLTVDKLFGPFTDAAVRHYQRGHALTADGVVGPRTLASVNGPVTVGTASGQVPGGALPPPRGGTLRYDDAGYTIAPPPPLPARAPAERAKELDRRIAFLFAQIQAKQARKPPELGPTVSVAGVARRSVQELFLWNIMFQLGQRSRWATEADLVTAIDFAPGAVGRVTVRIDASGNATVTLVAAGPVPAAPGFPDRAAAEAALKAAFGFSSVRDGSAPWTLAELAKVHSALQRMPAADRSALDGVDLVREHTVLVNGSPAAGRFEHTTSLAARATTATRSATLTIADSAFAQDTLSFIGDGGAGAPASAMTILHEAGHAVETKAVRDATFARMQEEGRFNAATDVLNTAITTANAAGTAAVATMNTYPPAQQQQAKAFLRAVNRYSTALDNIGRNKDPADNAALETDALAARATRDQAHAALPAKHPARADFASTIAGQNSWHTAARERARINAEVHRRQAEEAAAQGTGRSRRLDGFVAVVNANNIPPLTAYAAQNWPGHPEEFFAEAHSLWLNDRAYLQTNAPALVTWFDGGGHRI